MKSPSKQQNISPHFITLRDADMGVWVYLQYGSMILFKTDLQSNLIATHSGQMASLLNTKFAFLQYNGHFSLFFIYNCVCDMFIYELIKIDHDFWFVKWNSFDVGKLMQVSCRPLLRCPQSLLSASKYFVDTAARFVKLVKSTERFC